MHKVEQRLSLQIVRPLFVLDNGNVLLDFLQHFTMPLYRIFERVGILNLLDAMLKPFGAIANLTWILRVGRCRALGIREAL
jgi:hypothetical protein